MWMSVQSFCRWLPASREMTQLALMFRELRASGCTALIQNGHPGITQASVTQHGLQPGHVGPAVGADVSLLLLPAGGWAALAWCLSCRNQGQEPRDWLVQPEIVKDTTGTPKRGV